MPSNGIGMTMKDIKGFRSRKEHKPKDRSNKLESIISKLKQKHDTDKKMSNNSDVSNRQNYNSLVILDNLPP